jgi:hypothetical protein
LSYWSIGGDQMKITICAKILLQQGPSSISS